jgi:hypothetical protein
LFAVELETWSDHLPCNVMAGMRLCKLNYSSVRFASIFDANYRVKGSYLLIIVLLLILAQIPNLDLLPHQQ